MVDRGIPLPDIRTVSMNLLYPPSHLLSRVTHGNNSPIYCSLMFKVLEEQLEREIFGPVLSMHTKIDLYGDNICNTHGVIKMKYCIVRQALIH